MHLWVPINIAVWSISKMFDLQPMTFLPMRVREWSSYGHHYMDIFIR